MDFDFEFPRIPSKLGNRKRKLARCKKRRDQVDQNVDYAPFYGPVHVPRPQPLITPERVAAEYAKITSGAPTVVIGNVGWRIA